MKTTQWTGPLYAGRNPVGSKTYKYKDHQAAYYKKLKYKAYQAAYYKKHKCPATTQ